jgi:hypothetical protein
MTAARRDIRVLFAHGLEGSPSGNKARLLAECFDALTPAMDTSDFEACVALHARAVETFAPHVLVGSSFGGAVAVELLQRRLFRGPTLLLAQAARHLRADARLPDGVPVRLVHAPQDAVVAFEGSRILASTGTGGLVELVAVDDDHALRAFTRSDGLQRAVIELHGRYCVGEPPTHDP